MTRLITGLLLAPAIAYTVIWGPVWLFLPVLTAIALLCFHEYSFVVSKYGIEKPGVLGFAAGLLILLLPELPVSLLVLAALLTILASLRFGDLAKGLPYSGALLFGVLYIFGAWRLAAELRAVNPYWLLFALAINWVGDTSAYFVGRAIGRHRLAPQISPGKSWEGTIGSLVISSGVWVALLPLAIPGVSLLEAAVLSILANVAGQCGDLAESALKRGAGVKDSGTMLPGHGGWLDRVDSSLFSVPVVYLLLSALGRL